MILYDDCDKFAEYYCKEVIERIKNILDERKISQGTLASKSGLGQSTVSKFLAGDTKVSLIHVAKICHALEIDPGEILSLNHSATNTLGNNDVIGGCENGMLIRDPSHPAFKGYLREFKVYFNSTISTEQKILHGDLKIHPSANGLYCAVELDLDTGKKHDNGEPAYKKYKGKMIISLTMSACYCILTEPVIGEICFMVFSHMFLFNEELVCRMACVTTVSSGGNKRPTMHRLLISRVPLDVSHPDTEDFKFLKGQFKLNSSYILIEKSDYEKFKKEETSLVEQNEILELLDEFDNSREHMDVYWISEAKLRNANCATKDKIQLISSLRAHSLNEHYNKVSTKTDEYIYNYLEQKASSNQTS